MYGIDFSQTFVFVVLSLMIDVPFNTSNSYCTNIHGYNYTCCELDILLILTLLVDGSNCVQYNGIESKNH